MLRRRIKIAGAVFFFSVTALVLGALAYLQGEHFASIVKQLISDRAPTQLGVNGDFSTIKLHYFPPGIGILNPKVRVSPDNVASIPVEATIDAEEVWLTFAPLQMLSGTLTIDNIVIREGGVVARLNKDALQPKRSKRKKPSTFSFRELFDVEVERVTLLNTSLSLSTLERESKSIASGVVGRLEIAKRNSSVPAFLLEAEIQAVQLPLSQWFTKFRDLIVYRTSFSAEFSEEGLTSREFELVLQGATVGGAAKITGNLLDSAASPELDFQIKGSADLGLASGYFGLSDVSGKVSAAVEGRSKLYSVDSTLIAKAMLNGASLEYQGIKADHFEASALLDLVRQELREVQFSAADVENPKVQNGVRLRAGRLPLSFSGDLEAQVELDQARLHWLLGPLAQEVTKFTTDLTGKILLSGNGVSKNSVGYWQIRPDLTLTNLKLGSVLNVPDAIKLKGPVQFSKAGVTLQDVSVSRGAIGLVVNGAVGKEGFDLNSLGNVDLRDLGPLIGTPLLGTGKLNLSVRGPSSRVVLDFDANLKAANYLGLNLGDLEGNVKVDLGLDEVSFHNLRSKFGRTFYTVKEGKIDISGGDDLNIPIRIQDGRAEEVAVILDRLVSKLEWYPRTLKGQISGDVLIHGKIDLPQLKVDADLQGTDWSWKSEKFRRVQGRFSLENRIYSLKNLVATKTTGEFSGNVSFDSKSDEISWSLDTKGLSLKDVDAVDRLDVPARAQISVNSWGKGRISNVESKTDIRVSSTLFRGEDLADSGLRIETSDYLIRSQLRIFGDQVEGSLRYATLDQQPSQFNLAFRQFDFSPLILILNPKLVDDSELRGTMSGGLNLEFLTNRGEFARGKVELDQYLIAKKGFKLELATPVKVPVQLGFFNIPPTTFRSEGNTLTLTGTGNRGQIDARLSGAVDLRLLEFVSGAIAESSGKALVQLRGTGTIKAPDVSGVVDIKSERFLLGFIQSPVESLSGEVKIQGNKILADRLRGDFGGAAVYVQSKITTHADAWPEIMLRVMLGENRIQMKPLESIQPKGYILIEGTEPPYKVGGSIRLDGAVFTKSFGGNDTSGADGDRFSPDSNERGTGTTSTFVLDLPVSFEKGFWVRNEILDAEFRGQVTVKGEPGNPGLIGDMELIQGKILFKDRPFKLEATRVDFTSPYAIEPAFSASAVTEISNHKLRLLAQGVGAKFKAELSSVPFLPEPEIYSLLSSGFTTKDVGRFRGGDRTYVNQGEAASLVLHQLEFSRDVEKRTGFAFEFGEAFDNQKAVSAFNPRAAQQNVAAPKVTVRRRLGRNLDLSFGSTVGVGTQTAREVNAAYRLNSAVSVLGVWTAFEGVNNRDARTSYGIDFRVDKRFK